MSSFRLLWAIFGPDQTFENSQRGKMEEATLDEALACLDNVLEQSGIMELVLNEPSGTGPQGLQIRSEKGLSVITLAEVDEKKEKNIRTYRLGDEGDVVHLLGGEWDSRMICKDDSVIRQMLSELYTTENISREILS